MSFFQRELEFRQELFYPPFSRLILLRLSGLKAETVERAARRMAGLVREEVRGLAGRRGLKILGPAPAPVVKVRNRFRWRVLIKARTSALGRAVLEPALARAEGLEELKRVRLTVDVDPINML
jgi:primosomal protein N' (replication factor Y)